MSKELLLLPTPRHLDIGADQLSLSDGKLIVLDGATVQALRFGAGRVQHALRQYANVDWQVTASTAVPAEQVGLTLNVAPGASAAPQGYTLTVTARGIFIVAATAAGAFYGGLTLIQILEQCGHKLPLLHINDWPDFPNRGVMLDISRDKVPTMATLFDLVDMLASWKINQLQLYTEHTFAYQNHPAVWAGASPMMGEEILALDAYCRERFIELVPNQNTFGHMWRWLSHAGYRYMAECPDGWDSGDAEWGSFGDPITLAAADPDSLPLLTLAPEHPDSLPFICSLLDELGPHFSSRQFNIGCDETVELGKGVSQEIVAQRGIAGVYLDFLLKIYRQLKLRGYRMQFWADMVMVYPQLVSELPRDSIALEWGYEADHPFDEHGAKFAAAGVPFYVCPGTSSWNSIAGRTETALENLRSAARNGLKYGAVGYLNTDWGNNGHWQPLPVSYLAFGYGAALSWAYQANRDLDVVRATSIYAFHDDTGAAGRLAYDLGNVYREPGLPQLNNESVLYRILRETRAEIALRPGLTAENLHKTADHLTTVAAPLAGIRFKRADANLLRREFQWQVDMLQHACRRGIWALGQDGDALQLTDEAGSIIAEYREIWLARNRPGGLQDSLARLEKMKSDYVD